MKVNLTKKHIEDLEKAVQIIKRNAKNSKGQVKKDELDVAVTIGDILVRHDNRTEKEY
jgi:hypothetical protein